MAFSLEHGFATKEPTYGPDGVTAISPIKYLEEIKRRIVNADGTEIPVGGSKRTGGHPINFVLFNPSVPRPGQRNTVRQPRHGPFRGQRGGGGGPHHHHQQHQRHGGGEPQGLGAAGGGVAARQGSVRPPRACRVRWWRWRIRGPWTRTCSRPSSRPPSTLPSRASPPRTPRCSSSTAGPAATSPPCSSRRARGGSTCSQANPTGRATTRSATRSTRG